MPLFKPCGRVEVTQQGRASNLVKIFVRSRTSRSGAYSISRVAIRGNQVLLGSPMMESLALKYINKFLQADNVSIPGPISTQLTDHAKSLSDSKEAIKSGLRTGAKSADYLFPVLKQCCESKIPRLIELALKTLNALIEHGYLQGTAPISADAETEDVTSKEKGDDKDEEKASESMKNKTMMDDVIETINGCTEIANDDVQLQAIKVLLTAVTANSCEVHASSLLLSIQSCFHIHLVTTNQVNKVTTKAVLTQMISTIMQEMEKSAPLNISSNESSESLQSELSVVSDVSESDGFKSASQKDAYLIFRALCKLSMKGPQDEFDLLYSSRTDLETNHVAIQNKLLSLELILHTLKNAGPCFRKGDKFTEVIRKYLCMSLLANCTSQVPRVTGLSLQIFVALTENFKDHLKTEFEIFFTSIFLKILESENSSLDHKARVLEVFHTICKDPTTLVEFFTNYDCDLDSTDVFKRIVDGFTKTVKSTPSMVSEQNRKTYKEEQHLKEMGLSGLVMILNSLLQLKGWTDEQLAASGMTPNSSAPAEEEDTDLSPTNAATTVVDTLSKKLRMKEGVEVGITKFNLNAKKGLLYLVQVECISMEPASVAKFLHMEERLDKTMIGEFISREPDYMDGFPAKVLHEYVELIDFVDMPFDVAIRHFLSGFRLPGESQKIDRLMEKFAERYYLQNTNEFASADMAFILAFSTIMLQTNLHNPAIKEEKRMTKPQWIKQNTGITSDGELREELLIEIYDRIAAEPISLSSDEDKRAKKGDANAFTFQAASDESRRIDAFNDERKEMMRTGQSLIKKRNASQGGLFIRTSNDGTSETFVKPMFELAWAPIIGALSHVFEGIGNNTSSEKQVEPEDETVLLTACLTAFRYGIRLAGRLDFGIGRSTYINALSKFTALDMCRPITTKNIECVKTLIAIPLTEGDYLMEDWHEIFLCMSRLSRLQMFSSGLVSDDIFFSDTSHGKDGFGNPLAPPSEGDTSQKNIELSNAVLLSTEVSMQDLDSIFLNSSKLNATSVEYFIKELCTVSLEEINNLVTLTTITSASAHANTPRIFSLQKLVEVADFNMHSRSRMEWNSMWTLLAQHFTTVGTQDNLSLAMYAIDSLKQLSIKFLQKEELSNFNFQRIFLKPFEVIMKHAQSVEIKDLVLRCIDMMMLACAANIRSGWKSIFNILQSTALDEDEDIAATSMSIISRLIDTWYGHLATDLGSFTNCLVAFAACPHQQLCLQALIHLGQCADKMASLDKDGNTVSNNNGYKDKKGRQDDDGDVYSTWFPLLVGLSTQVADSRLEVRIKALDVLYNTLSTHWEVFSIQAWVIIFRGVLFPMLDSAKTDDTQHTASSYPTENPTVESNSDSWIGTMGLRVLNILIELYQKVQSKDTDMGILPDFLSMLAGCICQGKETLARMGITTFGDLVISISQTKRKQAVNAVIAYVCSIVYNNLCMHFGPAGILICSQDIPAEVKTRLLSASSSKGVGRMMGTEPATGNQARNGSHEEQVAVSTAYGEGVLLEVQGQSYAPGIPPRHVIQLPWGILYEPIYEDDSSASSDTPPNNRGWDDVSQATMTSMVVSLDIIHVITLVCDEFKELYDPQQIEQLLTAIETAHWHARSFNEDSRLSIELKRRGFMRYPKGNNSPPNLLEQEIRTAASILSIANGLSHFPEYTALVNPWIKCYTEVVMERYLLLDGSLTSSNPIQKDLIDAYKPAVMSALQCLSQCTPAQCQAYNPWVMPMITRLVLCHDYEVRVAVATVMSSFVHYSGAVASITHFESENHTAKQ